MEDHTPTDEISLRDLYVILHRWRFLIVGLTLGAALVALAVSLVLPKRYESVGVYSLSLETDKMTAPLTNLPTLTGLMQGYSDSLGTTARTKELAEAVTQGLFAAKYDEKRGLWSLTGVGVTPELAKERADRLMLSAQNYIEDRVSNSVKVNIAGTLEQSKVDLSILEQSLQRIGDAMVTTPQVSNRDGATTAGLEAQSVNPLSARSNNPAFVALAVQQSQLKAQRAQLQARVQTYTELVNNPARLKAFTGQALSIQTIAEPTVPQSATSPRPALIAAIAGILGLLIGLILPFLIEAVRDPEAERTSSKRSLSVAAD